MRNHSTICKKHDNIDEWSRDIIDAAEKIIEEVYNAKDDGMRMEKGLEDKNKEIEELKKEIADHEDTIYQLEKDIEELLSSRTDGSCPK